jgi:hypothetical protein
MALIKKSRVYLENVTNEIKNDDLKIHLQIDENSNTAIGYVGTLLKPTFYVKNWKSTENFNGAVNKWLKEIIEIREEKINYKNSIKNKNKNYKASDFYKVDDIIYNSWGFDQTNIEFYKIIEIKNKSIICRQLKSIIVEMYDHGMAAEIIAADEFYNNELITLKTKIDLNNTTHIIPNEKFYSFYKWNGQQLYRSWYA